MEHIPVSIKSVPSLESFVKNCTQWIKLGWLIRSEVCLTTGYTPLPCRIESSWGHDDAFV